MNEGLHGIAVYNPSLSSDAELRQCFVARKNVLDRIIEEIGKEKTGTAPQHQLILGLRGMGKTTLLRRIAIAVQDDPLLNAEWLSLTFPEEQYNVATPRDFWFNCLDSLCDILEKSGNKAEADHIDALIEQKKADNSTADQILHILVNTAKRIQKRLILLIDNIDFIFDRLKEYHWNIREILQSEPQLLVIGASHRAMEATYEYEAAFYDFFRIHELKKLTREETYEILRNLAHFEQSIQVARLIEREPARINALHTLTGGNPRTIVLLFKVLDRGLEGDVRSDLEGLLDMVTPLYKARFEELPSLSQQVVGAIALHWDPIMARGIATETNMPVNKVSAQLSRLMDHGIIEEVTNAKGRRAAYQISERFFNIWYLMRASRRVKRKLIWLVYFLKIFFSPQELFNRAIALLGNERVYSFRNAEFSLALAQATPPEMAVALEHRALWDLRKTGYAELVNQDPAYSSMIQYMDKIDQIRETVQKNLPNANMDQQELIDRILGSPSQSLHEKEMIAERMARSDAERDSIKRAFDHEWNRWKIRIGIKNTDDLYTAIRTGIMKHYSDMDGAKSAALRLNNKTLAHLPLGMGALFTEDYANNHQDIQSACHSAMELEPNAAWPYVCLATFVANQTGDLEEANRLLDMAIEKEPSHVLAWNNLGVLYLNQNRLDKAEDAFKKASTFDTSYPYGWRNLWILYSILKRFEDAEHAFLKSIEINPEKTGVWMELAYFQAFHMNKPEEAVKSARKAIELEPENATAWNNLGFIQAHCLNDYSNARDSFQRGIQIDPIDAFGLNSLGDLQFHYLNEQEDAVVTYSLAEKAGVSANVDTKIAIATTLTLIENWPVVFHHINALLVTPPEIFPSEKWDNLLVLLRIIIENNKEKELLEMMDSTVAHDYWRPLREAVAAMTEKSLTSLHGVAPEIRDPAMDLVKKLSPHTFDLWINAPPDHTKR